MSVFVHASCVRIGAAGAAFGAPAEDGVLFLGESGTGKSDLALQLIQLGAVLVADDRTELYVERNALYGRAHPRGAGLIEAREVGIVRLPSAAWARIGLVVALQRVHGPRLPEPCRWQPPEALVLSEETAPYQIALANGPGAAAKVALALAAYRRGLHWPEGHTL